MLREVKLAVAEDLVKMAAGEFDEEQDVKFFVICCKVKDNSGQAEKVENHFEKVCTVLVLGADQEFKTELKVQLTTTLKSLDYYDSLLEGEGGVGKVEFDSSHLGSPGVRLVRLSNGGASYSDLCRFSSCGLFGYLAVNVVAPRMLVRSAVGISFPKHAVYTSLYALLRHPWLRKVLESLSLRPHPGLERAP